MIYLLFILILSVTLVVRATRTWPVSDVPTLLDIVSKAEPGDVIELEPGEYVFKSNVGALSIDRAPLQLDRPLTLRSRDRRHRAILRNDGSSLLIAITSELVTVSDLIIGRQLSGADERSIDVLVTAGTQTLPSNARSYYNNNGGARQLLPSRGEILAARAIQTAPGAADQLRKRYVDARRKRSMRAVHYIDIENVDFSASRSGTNVAFARGSYAQIALHNNVFGRDGATHINAIVGVGDAQFIDLSVRGNSFVDASVLLASASIEESAVALNHWPGDAGPQVYIGGNNLVPQTYCLDARCTRLAPVIDANDETHVFLSLQAALDAGIRAVRVTDDITIRSAVTVTASGTTIEGGKGCDGAPLITVETGGAIVSHNDALIGVRNLRVALRGENAAAFVFSDGKAQRFVHAKFVQEFVTAVDVGGSNGATDESVVLFDGVSVLGDQSDNQVAVLLSAPKVRVEVDDTIVVQVQYGAYVHRGAFVSVDSSYFSAHAVAIYVETVTRQTALRVTGSTFIGSEKAIELGLGGSSSALREFYVSCSQFLFNRNREPVTSHDCAKKPTLCAAALRYNTIVTDHEPHDPQSAAAKAEQHLMRQGANHVEHARDRTNYVFYGEPDAHFSLTDDQGRLSWVSGQLAASTIERSAFLLASYAPLRSECLEVDGVSPEASVVSDVLEVRSDSLLHQCTALAARFKIDDEQSLPAALAVYGVTHLGSDSRWTRALARVQRHSADDVNNNAPDNVAIVEATLAVHNAEQQHLHRIVVVALAALPEALEQALQSGGATTVDAHRAVARRLCVACGSSSELPAHLLDTHCGGSTDNVRSSFDEAYTEIGFGEKLGGAPRHDAASLFVFGQCESERCSILLDQNEHLEGASNAQRGVLSRAAHVQCGSEEDDSFVVFSGRASKAGIRHVVIDASNVEKAGGCAVSVRAPSAESVGGPTVAYSSVRGSLCIDSRAGGRYIGNDIGGEHIALLAALRGSAPTTPSGVATRRQSLIIEANHFATGAIVLEGGDNSDSAPYEVRFDRNTFGATAADNSGLRIEGNGLTVRITSNENLPSLEVDTHSQAKVSALGNTFAHGASIELRGHATLAGASDSAPLESVHIAAHESVRFTDVALDAASVLSIDGGASVVLRQVLFEAVGQSLQTQHAIAACASFELSTAGIDLSRSTLFDADGAPLFSQAALAQVKKSDGTAYFATDGSVARCANDEQPVRTEEHCGCPVVVVEEEEEKIAAADINKIVDSKKVANGKNVVVGVQSHSSSEHSNTTLFIVLAVLGGILILCLIGACIWAAGRSDYGTTSTSASNAMQSRAPARPATAHYNNFNNKSGAPQAQTMDKEQNIGVSRWAALGLHKRGTNNNKQD